MNGASGGAALQAGMEIVFYDVETTVPEFKGQGYEILEFGAVVVSAKGLEELDSFTTLVRPSSPAAVSPRSTACNGITSDTLLTAPLFHQVAPRIHALLHGRVWAGHNILRFDNLRIREAFAAIGKPGPEAAGFIDTLPLLRKSFGTKAGNLKLNTLASYFGLGKQEHRSLSDVRMNIEVLKLCSTVLFLESNFPDIYPPQNSSPQPVTPYNTRRSSSSFNFNLLAVSLEETLKEEIKPESNGKPDTKATEEQDAKETSSTPNKNEAVQDFTKVLTQEASDLSTPNKSERDDKFLLPNEVCLENVEAVFEGNWINLMHGSHRLCVQERNSRVKFTVGDRYAFTDTGKPTFAIVIVPSAEVLAMVKHCEAVLKNKCREKALDVVWQPVLVFSGSGEVALRVKIGTTGEGPGATYTTVMYTRKDGDELDQVCLPDVQVKSFQQTVPAGSSVDVSLRCAGYAFQGGKVGLTLLVKHLILN